MTPTLQDIEATFTGYQMAIACGDDVDRAPAGAAYYVACGAPLGRLGMTLWLRYATATTRKAREA